MRPTDPRVLRRLVLARGPLAAVVLGSAATGLVIVVQAFALAALVVAAVRGDDLLLPAALVGAVFVAKAAFGVVTEIAAARAAARVGTGLRHELAEAVLAGSAETVSDGELAALGTRGVNAVEPYVTRYLPALLLAVVLPSLTVIAMATQDLLSAVIVLCTLPLVPVFGALVGLATQDRARSQWRAMASLSGHFVDVMRGLPTLVAFRRADAQARTIRATAERYRTATLQVLRIAFASSAVLELVATLSVAIVAVVVGCRLAAGGLDLRTALVVLLLAPEAYWPLRRVGAEFHAAAEGVATFEKIAELAVVPASSAVEPPAGRQPIRATEVAFAYPGRETPALASVTLEFAPRAITVVTGPSGCGKSTLLALLAGLVEPTTGSVTIGGVPASDISWQSQVAWIPQRPAFLTGTVAAHLRVAHPAATDEALWQVLDQVALAERVRAAGGLDGSVGEDGGNFSAGERARLSLARAVLSQRPWVLLDEPTAHLDPVTQQVMLDVLVALSRSRGVIVVAHEPAVIAVADHVVRLEPAVGPSTVGHPSGRGEHVRAQVPGPLPEGGAPVGFGLSTVLGILASSSGVALTATAGWLIVKAAEHPAVLTMLLAIVGVRAFGLGRPVFRYAERLRSHDAALRLLAEKRVEVYEMIAPLTPGRLGTRRGEVLASVVDDVEAVVDRELRIRLPLRTYGAVVVLAGAVAALVLPVAGAVLLVGGVLGAGTAYGVARRGCTGAERAAVAVRGALAAEFVDAGRVAPEVRMWQAGSVVLDPVVALSRRLGDLTQRAAAAVAFSRATLHLVTLGGVVAMAALGSAALGAGRVTGPGLALLILLPVALAEVAGGVVEAGSLVGRVQAAEARLQAYRTLTPAVSDPAVPARDPRTTEVVAGDLTLGWDGTAVLSDLDLTLAPGEHVAVVGPSGCGKSTLAASLIRFIDPLGGEVRFGEVPLPDLALDSVRRQIGYVDDDPHVFATSLAENVRLARPDASDDDVLEALRAARLGDWVASLPDGLHSWLGDGHGQVSGGERARLGLARSLLLDQSVLVLDEPVAHLDRATAQRLTDDLLDAAGDQTVVWITHSDLGLGRMDRVIDLG